jgi:glycerol-3-phosphate acyltransferase PlsY
MATMMVFLSLCYLMAAIPFGVIVTTLWGGDVDIRVAGSGNIGATNVARVYGWHLAGPVVGLDMLKGFVPVLLCQLLWPEMGLWWCSLVACTAFIGHCFPVYLEFQGGKGVATGAGALLAVAPIPTLVAAAIWGAVLAWTGRASAAALVAAVGLVGMALFWNPTVMPIVLLLCTGVGLTHIANIGRLVRGQEAAVIKPVRLKRSEAETPSNPLEEAPGGTDSPAPPQWTGKSEDPLDEE